VAEFVPENWVILRLGERKRLHFFHHVKVTRVTTDPITGEPRRRESLVFYVDEEDGVKVDKMLSILSRRLAQELSAYIPGKRYLRYDFVIEKPPDKFAAPRVVEVIPRG